MQPMIICAALTGGGAARADSPYHPVTPKAIANEAYAAWRAGAAIVHCHARLEDGTATNDATAYRDLLARIRDTGCEAIVNFSAGDNGGKSHREERLAVIDTGAEVVSLGGGAFNRGDRTSDTSPALRRDMALRMRACGVIPDFELYDMGQLHGLHWLAEQGLMPANPLVTLCAGIAGGIPIDLDALRLTIRMLPSQANWFMLCKTSDFTAFRQLMLFAFALGGHVRTGMEDFVYVRPGVLAKSNAEMVAQWVETAAIWGRPVANATQAREQLSVGESFSVVNGE